MDKSIKSLRQTFESSCGKTQQYLRFHRMFKREFTQFLSMRGITDINIAKPNHFDFSGFFRVRNQAYWFRLEDLRWSKDSLLIRTAKDFKDYTGGKNYHISLKSLESFTEDFDNIVDEVRL